MAGELNIMDETLEQEFLSCPTPIAFIDFETFMPDVPGIIPGTMITDLIPCQWSCHTMYNHGLNWQGNLRHGEFLWTGDIGWSPIYAFVQSLYYETQDANSIWIYTDHEIRSLNACKQLAENDMAAWSVNDILSNYYMEATNGDLISIAYAYEELYDFAEYGTPLDFAVYDSNGNELSPNEYTNAIMCWKSQDPMPIDYVVVDADGHKIPLMDIAPYIKGWCDSIISRVYDQCYGIKSILEDGSYKRGKGGIKQWMQSPALHQSNSIKYVMPAAMAEYSQSEDLLASEGEPINGYEGLRAMGNIAKGDECQSYYLKALNRPVREGVPYYEDGAAPFDANTEAQCLIYCRLDTLSMVLIYLAVLEATERWREGAALTSAGYALFEDDGLMHSVLMDADNQVFYKDCDVDLENPYPYSYELELYTEEEFNNLPIVKQYELMCPQCRRIRNTAY